MPRKSYKDHSRTNWMLEQEEEKWPGYDVINSGSLQRIADATEIMAKNYVTMQNELERYKGYYTDNHRTIGHLQRSISAYKAHNTRLRNIIARTHAGFLNSKSEDAR